MKSSRLVILFLLVVVVIGAGAVGYKRSKDEADLSSISNWDVSRYHSPRSAVISVPSPVGFSRVPLTWFGGLSESLGELYVNEYYVSKFVAPGLEILFPFSGVPVDLQIINGQYNFAFRKVFGGQLYWLTYDKAGQLLKEQPIIFDDVDFPIFRASVVGEGHLYWVLYDNKKRKNFLMGVDQAVTGSGLMIELPTFYPPAGGTYEMEPPIFIVGDAKHGFELIAGALHAKIKDGKVESQRLSYCETVVEAIFTKEGPVVLCRTPETDRSSYLMSAVGQGEPKRFDMAAGIPWDLHYSQVDGTVTVKRAQSKKDILAMFLRDMRHGQQSGVLEFGVNNIEGRVPWSQIYYLNGLMDVLLLSELNSDAHGIFEALTNDLVSRIVLEMRSLDDLLDSNQGFYTKGFTHDRSPALFAVQTSRLLLLLDRYAEDFPKAPRLRNTEKLRSMVATLKGHIDQLAHEGEDPAWMKSGSAHLRWPKCSAFYFDGMAVPFNHQNEWAYSLFNSARVRGESSSSPDLNDQRDIIEFFLHRLSTNGKFPSVDNWYYWYGHAYDGWTDAEMRSCNMPSYPGDHGLAWISFRTIDFMSVMSSLDFIKDLDGKRLTESGVEVVKRGDVFPFASRSLLAVGKTPQIEISVLERYYRVTAPWEIANAPWALVMGFDVSNNLRSPK
ncbi:hypothetical protein ACW9IB_02890 [Pseudomonas sp. SDO524_S393]